jgi:MOSC domain-containing protein YiiM
VKVLSVNVGLPEEILWQDKTVRTGIFKKPVTCTVSVRRHNLEGDGQADLSVHGGTDKAVYAYPSEHYPFWESEFPEVAISWGMFGENLTTIGLSEEAVRIGDRFLVGSAELIVTQPRMPCFKLGLRFGRKEVVKRFLTSEKSGWYLSVATEGSVCAGDHMELIEREENTVSVKEILAIHESRNVEKDLLLKVVQIKGLSESWRDHFIRRLEKLEP